MAKAKAKAKKVSEERPVFFKAELELTTITTKSVRYRVINPEGALNNIHHIEFVRTNDAGEDTKIFPIDDDFSLSFINADLKNAKPYPNNEAENMLAEEKELAEEALKNTKEKQAEFKKFCKFELVIS